MNRSKPCKYILNKEKCPFGRRCRFLHQSEEESSHCEEVESLACGVEGVQLKGEGDDRNGSAEDRNLDVQSDRVDHSSCSEYQLPHKPEQSPESNEQKKPAKHKVTRVCRFYLQQRGCRFGDQCKFVHSRSGVAKKEKPPPPGQDQGRPRESAEEHQQHPPPLTPESGSRPQAQRPHKLDRPRESVEGHQQQPLPLTPASTGSRPRVQRSHKSDRPRESVEDHPPRVTPASIGTRPRVQHPRKSDRPRESVEDHQQHPPPLTLESFIGHVQCPRKLERPRESAEDHQQHPPPLTLASFIGTRPHVQRPRKFDQNNSNSLREVELEQLQARFPGDNCSLLTKSKEKISYLIKFQPADQDWNGPAVLPLEVTFPSNYPDDYCEVKLASQELASDVVSCGNQAIKNYWNPSMLRQLMFRPFLHWWDKNLVEVLQTPFAVVSDTNSVKDAVSDDSAESYEEDVEEKDLNLQPQVKSKRGTEIRFLGLDLSQTLGTAFWSAIKLVIACERCKNHQEIEVKEERLYSVICGRCSCSMCIIYHLALIHLSSSTLGYVELTRCTPVDVIFQFSSFAITCLNCSSEVISQGFSIGQPKDVYCHRCHNKITLSATGIKFLQHQQAGDVSGKEAEMVCVHLSSKKRGENNLKDGEPLPEYGACQHYKKSHRWLRFPCCGRAFPCDVCHDSTQDHPMELATRMICGYCSKEQGYTGKGNCARCGADLVSSKHSAHWEGGQGCRNRTKMDRLDKQKYKNSDSKTVCKKSERVGKK